MVLSLWKGLIPTKPRMADIAADVAGLAGVSLDELRGPSRRRVVSMPRQEAMAKIYDTGHFSLPQIGRFFGDRDHTTVLHAVRVVAQRQAVAA